MLKLDSLGFGGPVALVGYMHRDLVERRNWISEADVKDGLALAQTAPGPLAAQLAIYLGYVRYHVLGASSSDWHSCFPPSSWSWLSGGRMFVSAVQFATRVGRSFYRGHGGDKAFPAWQASAHEKEIDWSQFTKTDVHTAAGPPAVSKALHSMRWAKNHYAPRSTFHG
jgi:hypothetical protein